MKVSVEALSKVEIITNKAKIPELRVEMGRFGITGMTIYQVKGFGVQMGMQEFETEPTEEPKLLDKVLVMVVLPSEEVDSFLDFVEKELYTGHIGDGKIFVSPVTNAIRIRTGEEGTSAIEEGTAY